MHLVSKAFAVHTYVIDFDEVIMLQKLLAFHKGAPRKLPKIFAFEREYYKLLGSDRDARTTRKTSEKVFECRCEIVQKIVYKFHQRTGMFVTNIGPIYIS